MVLRGIDMLSNILNEFLAAGGWEVTVEAGTDFSYWHTSSTIEYALCVTDWAGERFLNYVHHLAPDIKCDIFLISFLHELGHHETYEDLSEDDIKFSTKTKETINQLLTHNDAAEALGLTPKKDEIKEAAYDLYFALPDECAATTWAIDYIRNNAKQVAELWERVQAAIMLIYEINEVEVV